MKSKQQQSHNGRKQRLFCEDRRGSHLLQQLSQQSPHTHVWAGTREEEGGEEQPIRSEHARRLFNPRAARSVQCAAASSVILNSIQNSRIQPLQQASTGTLWREFPILCLRIC